MVLPRSGLVSLLIDESLNERCIATCRCTIKLAIVPVFVSDEARRYVTTSYQRSQEHILVTRLNQQGSRLLCSRVHIAASCMYVRTQKEKVSKKATCFPAFLTLHIYTLVAARDTNTIDLSFVYK